MKLTEEQRMRVQKAASLGHEFYDCLILANVPAAEALERMKDRDLYDLFSQGRTQGAEKIREKLMAAAMAGNVSAMKCLALHEAPDEERDRRPQFNDGLTDQQRRAKWAAMVADLDRRFAIQRKLFEENHDKLNAKH
jgi:hypothetical protein